jgi:hypothetical protein
LFVRLHSGFCLYFGVCWDVARLFFTTPCMDFVACGCGDMQKPTKTPHVTQKNLMPVKQRFLGGFQGTGVSSATRVDSSGFMHRTTNSSPIDLRIGSRNTKDTTASDMHSGTSMTHSTSLPPVIIVCKTRSSLP